MKKKSTRKTSTNVKRKKTTTTKRDRKVPKKKAADIPGRIKEYRTVGRPPTRRNRKRTPEEVVEDRKASSRRANMATSRQQRDIGSLDVEHINWERRLATRHDLRLFSETYLPGIFYMGWSEDQLKCIQKMETVFIDGGMFALAMPRGGGKTALCRSGIVWGTAHAHRIFPYFIGSTAEKAMQTLAAVKTIWYRSPELQQDFPEIGLSVLKLENRYHLARGQLYNGQQTYVEWGSDRVRFPSLILPREVADEYLKHDPDSLRFIESLDAHMPKQSGILIATAGVDGSIRGEADVHPITLEQPRPDLALLDDVQKDQKAESPALCDKLIRLIEGAVAGLAGPGRHIAVLMPCTVIREGDVADTFLDRQKKPEYQGERCQMVTHWPPGITDENISLDTEEGKLWNKYDELRRLSLRRHGDLRLATKFYSDNREQMDNGFVCSWDDRYTKRGDVENKHFAELSAQQHAMNLRLKAPEAFGPEFQNLGRKLVEEGTIAITSEGLQQKTVDIERFHLPVETQYVSAFIDPQNEGFFYAVFGCSPDYTGIFCDYGTWPEVTTRYFTKGQMDGWGMLTREFFKVYPQHRDKAIRTKSGRIRAPLEAKIYFGLSRIVPILLNRQYTREGNPQTRMVIDKIAIDTRWGQASDVIKRYIREAGLIQLMPYYGQWFPPTNRQLEEYNPTKGWMFEHQRHPRVKEPRWLYRPNPDGMYYLAADVSRLKDFLFERLGTPPGAPGCISLFKAPPEKHEMFADHICNSEYPEVVTARGMVKNQWMEREGVHDNDWLDCATGCMAVASFLGACLTTGGESERAPTKVTSRWRRRGRERH